MDLALVLCPPSPPPPSPAPQVIRKIRGEPFPDASGHLKLWCQFFNILSDSTVKWYRDEVEILEVQRRYPCYDVHNKAQTTPPPRTDLLSVDPQILILTV